MEWTTLKDANDLSFPLSLIFSFFCPSPLIKRFSSQFLHSRKTFMSQTRRKHNPVNEINEINEINESFWLRC